MGLLIRGALCVLPDGEGHAATRGDIYVEGNVIAGVFEEPDGFSADETIDASGMLAIPGLVNAHTHSYMSILRNVADDLPFFDWLQGAVEPLEEQMEPEDAYWGSLLSQAEMIRSGTTCFNDMQMFTHQTTRAVAESGMRAVICRGLVGDAYDESDWRIAEALEERDAFAWCDRLTFRLGPHAPYSCGPDYLRLIADVAGEQGMGVHTHISESRAENEGVLRERGCTPAKYMRDAGIFEMPAIAAHCVFTDEADHAILAGAGVSVATNPASNMKLGNGFAPVPELMAAGVNVCLGTDGVASNNSQNMFREMGLLALIHKGSREDPTAVTADETLAMATRNGARALGLACGSIEAGNLADISLLDLGSPSLSPLNSPISALVYSATGCEVDTVVIDGKIVMSGRELKTIDEERVRFEVSRITGRLGLGGDCGARG